MSDDIAIRVSGLSKRYTIGANSARYRTLRETLVDAAAAPLRRLRSFGRSSHRAEDVVWALRDVSFDVAAGEALGVIGPNGAGKSTLLKLMSQITAPTAGRIELVGRVASLLEVGTGFHKELTGRENVYLNGAILGMTRREIQTRFDEIVAFAGERVQTFLDTPVKRYSSGMYVRLAFAVAAHLECEILLVDEVLAVGDLAFQKQCLGKMESVSRSGRTVFLVSHNMGVLQDLCSRVLWIDGGTLRAYGDAREVISQYAAESSERLGERFERDVDPARPFQLLSARLLGPQAEPGTSFSCDDPVVIDCTCRVQQTVPGLFGYLSINQPNGTVVMVSDSHDASVNPLDGLREGVHALRITIPPRTLAPGEYQVYINFTSHQHEGGSNVDSPGTVCAFALHDFGTRRGDRRLGFFSTRLAWDVEPAAR